MVKIKHLFKLCEHSSDLERLLKEVYLLKAIVLANRSVTRIMTYVLIVLERKVLVKWCV